MAVSKQRPSMTASERRRLKKEVDKKNRERLGLKNSSRRQSSAENKGGASQSFAFRCLAAANNDPLVALDLAIRFGVH